MFWDGTQWVHDAPAAPPRRRPVRHVLGAVAEAGLITVLTFGLVAGSAFAAKGGTHSGNGGHTSITISVPDGAFASTVQATVSSPGLWVSAGCSQSGTVVYREVVQTDADGHATLNLGPTSWWSGGAGAGPPMPGPGTPGADGGHSGQHNVQRRRVLTDACREAALAGRLSRSPVLVDGLTDRRPRCRCRYLAPGSCTSRWCRRRQDRVTRSPTPGRPCHPRPSRRCSPW